MSDELYDRWKRRRSEAELPPRFAEDVMATITANADAAKRSWGQALLLALLSSRLARIGVCSVAAAICVLRLWHAIAIFVPQ